jgi:hypothetical protein
MSDRWGEVCDAIVLVRSAEKAEDIVCEACASGRVGFRGGPAFPEDWRGARINQNHCELLCRDGRSYTLSKIRISLSDFNWWLENCRDPTRTADVSFADILRHIERISGASGLTEAHLRTAARSNGYTHQSGRYKSDEEGFRAYLAEQRRVIELERAGRLSPRTEGVSTGIMAGIASSAGMAGGPQRVHFNEAAAVVQVGGGTSDKHADTELSRNESGATERLSAVPNEIDAAPDVCVAVTDCGDAPSAEETTNEMKQWPKKVEPFIEDYIGDERRRGKRPTIVGAERLWADLKRHGHREELRKAARAGLTNAGIKVRRGRPGKSPQ